jgi:hypothetical protein
MYIVWYSRSMEDSVTCYVISWTGSSLTKEPSKLFAWTAAGRADRSCASCDRDLDIVGATCKAGLKSLESVFSSRLVCLLVVLTSLSLQNCALGSLWGSSEYRHDAAAASRAAFDALSR